VRHWVIASPVRKRLSTVLNRVFGRIFAFTVTRCGAGADPIRALQSFGPCFGLFMGGSVRRFLVAKQAANCLGFLLGSVLAGAAGRECAIGERRSFFESSSVVLVGRNGMFVAWDDVLALAEGRRRRITRRLWAVMV